ncbi:MAG TPA: septum formation initiator family protein [Vicinamibacterales bacterium]
MAGAGEGIPNVTPRPPGRRLPRTRQDLQNRRRRVFTYVVLITSTVLMVSALVGENGYLAKVRAGRDLTALRAEVNQLEDDNLRLADQAERLKHDPNTIEAAARHDLGLMEPGEVVVVVRDPNSPAPRDR